MEKIDLSIIIPSRNEEGNVKPLYERLNKAFRNSKIEYEVLYIVDKSVDNTYEEASKYEQDERFIVHKKRGKPGKGYSIVEGCEYAKGEYVAFIDADLQYPPEALPEMYKIAKEHGVVVAKRITYKSTFLRRLGSRFNAFFFGKVLLGLDCDIQSGLKVFKRDVLQHLDLSTVGPWTFDIPLLHTSSELGYKIATYEIDFVDRYTGNSKVSFIKTGFGIASCALKTRLKKRAVYEIKPLNGGSIGAGMVFKKHRFVIHSKRPHHNSALHTFVFWQKLFIYCVITGASVGLYIDARVTAIMVFAVLNTLYFCDVIFNLIVILKSLHFPPELAFSAEEIKNIDESKLPKYTILCPLYKEVEILPHFVENVSKLDYPKNKLEVLLLLEEDDKDTQEIARLMHLPNYFRIVVVPHSQPKTKPKACNYGLHVASGELTVIYDAEDQPEPSQLKKAYLGFKNLPEKVVCLQAKLNYYNPSHNLLTRLFTAEYSLWFDVVLPGYQSINTAIPLGGTSNHFKTEMLKKLHGWDAFNVTEDCDLGVNLFKQGYKTAIIDSTTLEEANSDIKNWIRQRSRWIKGYMQTYLVHMRNPLELIKTYGWHSFIFHLVIGARMYFMLINPILWLMTFAYFALYAHVGPTIESLYPPAVFYMGAFSLVVGNFVALYNYMIGCAKRGHWNLIKFVYLVPLYWLLASIGAVMAFYQLLFKPHFWEKTHHGLHLKKARQLINLREVLINMQGVSIRAAKSGSFLVAAGLITNFLNYVYNAFLSRRVEVEDFGLISLVGSLFFIASIPLSALSRTITYKTAFLLGKFNLAPKTFWSNIRKIAFVFGIATTISWVLLIPYLMRYFNTTTPLPFLYFTPVWAIGILAAVDSGFISGNQKFNISAILIISEAIAKLAFTFLSLYLNNNDLIYAAIPVSLVVPFAIGWLYIVRQKVDQSKIKALNEALYFPKDFFLTSLFIKFSTVSSLSLDILIVKHILVAKDAGYYALIALVGKMIFFIGGLFSQFITPVISKEVGAKEKTSGTFFKILVSSAFFSTIFYIALGLFGSTTAPILLGNKVIPVTKYLPLYGLAMLAFSVANNITGYYQIKKINVFPTMSLIIAVIELVLLSKFSKDLQSVVNVILLTSFLQLFWAVTFSLIIENSSSIRKNIAYLYGLFDKRTPSHNPLSLNILIFNWRDTKHVWAGGAETYVFDLAKNLVNKGHKVTIFCGNDHNNKDFEVMEGVEIYRRGGFYTVYLWAAIYYLTKFRSKFDFVIDSVNGIPFFSPLYVEAQKAVLIHHVHQEYFRRFVRFPVNHIASFVEKYLFSLMYRDVQVITVSESSKKDIVNILNFNEDSIDIVNPGINIVVNKRLKKTKQPTITYVGRLRHYKNIDLLIRSFSQILKEWPKATLEIVGDGEASKKLKLLTKDLNLSKKVTFHGKVSDADRNKVLTKAWVMVQPSSFEGWGITVIEANACGTPVIASDVVGLRDSVIANRTGLLFRLEDPNGLTNTLKKILRDEVLRKVLSESARQWSENFSWSQKADAVQSIILRKINTNYLLKTDSNLAKIKVEVTDER
ncbi:MAG: glycosyltransferase [Patescibacteria group bacterium]